MKAEVERSGRSWRPRLAFAVLAALSLAPASAASPANGKLGYPCGDMPGKLPKDETGLLASLPKATLAGYLDYTIPIKKSPYENFKPKHPAPWKVIHIGNFVGNDWHTIQIAQFDKTANAMKAAGLISQFAQVHADASVPFRSSRCARHLVEERVVGVAGKAGKHQHIAFAAQVGDQLFGLGSTVLDGVAANVDGVDGFGRGILRHDDDAGLKCLVNDRVECAGRVRLENDGVVCSWRRPSSCGPLCAQYRTTRRFSPSAATRRPPSRPE